MLGHVCGSQALHRREQHPGDIERDVARADDGDTGCGHSDSIYDGIWMPAVPGDEFGCRDAARKVLTRHRQCSIGTGSGRHDDRVVVGAQLGEGDVPTEPDVAQEPDIRPLHHLAQLLDDRLDLRMIGRDAVPNQTVGDG